MRKISKIFAVAAALTAVCSLGATGCKNEAKSDKTMICSFDSYEEVAAVSFANSFGKVDLIKESEHKTQGDYCAKLTVDGSKNSALKRPLMAVYTGGRYLDKTDFSDAVTFELDAYNDADSVKKIWLQLEVQSVDDAGAVTLSNSAEYPYELAPKTQTHVVWDFDRSFVSQFIDLKSTSLIKLIFEHPENGRDVYYIDNFFVTTTSEPAPYVKAREEGEIESAEKEEYLSSWYVTMPLHCPCNLYYNTDHAFVKKGNGSIRVSTPSVSMVNTPTVSYTRNAETDFSTYDGMSFYVYNANSKDYNLIFACGEKNRITKNFALKAGEWTRCEVTFAELKAFTDESGELADKFDEKNFNFFMLTFYFNEQNTPLNFYLDEFRAFKGDTRPPEMDVSEIDYGTPNAGEGIIVQKPAVERGVLVGWKVTDDKGNMVSENEETFSLSEPGIYRIEYRAENEYDDIKRTVTFRVGFPSIKQSVYGVSLEIPFDYEVPILETKNADELTWQLFNGESGTVVGDADQKSYHIENGEFYLEYVAKNAVGSVSCRIYLKNIPGVLYSGDFYKDFYDEKKLEFSSGKPTVVSDGSETAYGGEGIKLAGESGAKATIKTPVFLGYDERGTFMFSVYNGNAVPVKLYYGMGEREIPANSRAIVYVPVAWLKIWNCTTEMNGGLFLNAFSVSVNSYLPITVYDFSVTENVKTPVLELGDFDKNPVADGTSEYTVPTPANNVWKVEVFCVTEDGKQVSVTDGKFVPVPSYEYEFRYYVYNDYGKTEESVYITFADVRKARFISKIGNVVVKPDGNSGALARYLSAHMPVSDNGTVTCSATIWWADNPSYVMYEGVNEPFDPFNSQNKLEECWIYRLDWKTKNDYGESVYRQMLYVSDKEVLEISPETVSVSGEGELVRAGDDGSYSVRVTGVAELTFDSVAPSLSAMDIYTSNFAANNANLYVWNAGQTVVRGHESESILKDNGLRISNVSYDGYIKDGKLTFKLESACKSGVAELYLDFIVVTTK